jgi:hypothetical protein
MTTVRERLEPMFDAPYLGDDARRALLDTLADIPADELAEQLHRTVHVLNAYTTAAEEMDLATYCLLSEAEEKAQAMLAQLED